MMFVTREFDYAMRVVRVMAENQRMTVKEICGAEHVPQPYAYKILKKLEKADIVNAHRGAQGGYELAANPADVTVYDVYLAIEGSLYINQCMQDGYTCPNNHNGRHCGIHSELCALQEELVQNMRGRTMADML